MNLNKSYKINVKMGGLESSIINQRLKSSRYYSIGTTSQSSWILLTRDVRELNSIKLLKQNINSHYVIQIQRSLFKKSLNFTILNS
jgi:hypothetical protein